MASSSSLAPGISLPDRMSFSIARLIRSLRGGFTGSVRRPRRGFGFFLCRDTSFLMLIHEAAITSNQAMRRRASRRACGRSDRLHLGAGGEQNRRLLGAGVAETPSSALDVREELLQELVHQSRLLQIDRVAGLWQHDEPRRPYGPFEKSAGAQRR